MNAQVDDRPGADFTMCTIDPGCPCGAGGDATHSEDLAEVWCSRCDQPATVSVKLTTGETVFRCAQDAWLIRKAVS